MKTECPLCGAALTEKRPNVYEKCHECGSFVYQGLLSAEAENKAYFNEFFRETQGHQLDKRKAFVFRHWQKRDHHLRVAERQVFQKQATLVEHTLWHAPGRILDVGFGGGNLLSRLLHDGRDAYGEDLSEAAIHNFQSLHPEYADRVSGPSSNSGLFEIVYCSALFEHLDDPRGFMSEVCKRLSPNGVIILDNFPLALTEAVDLLPEEDINFWKPCHRLLCTAAGLKRLVRETVFRIHTLSTIDEFNYRVLSLHCRAGYQVIRHLRNSCLSDARLPHLWRYWFLCRRALHVRSTCHMASAMLTIRP